MSFPRIRSSCFHVFAVTSFIGFLAIACPLDAQAASGYGEALTNGDFNGDGFLDVAVAGNLGEDGRGRVKVYYGDAGIGVFDDMPQDWDQDVPGISGASEASDFFGFALAAGDFDGDGYSDLAVGVPGEDLDPANVDAGAVNVIYGSSLGLTAARNRLWHQNSHGVAGQSESYDFFGWSLEVGDFDGDGFEDLAVGAPFEKINQAEHAGMVNILYGSVEGLTAEDNEIFYQDRFGILEDSEHGDWFGHALAAGDFNSDGFSDLAIGAPGESFEEQGSSGTMRGIVNVLWGSTDGLSAADNMLLHQDLAEFEDHDQGTQYGWALAAGDFNDDGADDLAVLVPLQEGSEPGMVRVAFFRPTSPIGPFDERILLDGIVGFVPLAAGSFYRSGINLAIGLPNSSTCGKVLVLLDLHPDEHQPTGGGFLFRPHSCTNGTSDRFGYAVDGGDFTGDGRAQLIVGAPGSQEGRGSVTISWLRNSIYQVLQP